MLLCFKGLPSRLEESTALLIFAAACARNGDRACVKIPRWPPSPVDEPVVDGRISRARIIGVGVGRVVGEKSLCAMLGVCKFGVVVDLCILDGDRAAPSGSKYFE